MPLSILLADDSVPAQNMGKKILVDAGYDVLTVSNGLEALRKISELQPDIAILDIFMPGYTGLEICERLRANPATAALPVILTVGKLEPYRPEDGEHVHSNAIIVKPFSANELVSAVRSLIGAPADKTIVAVADPLLDDPPLADTMGVVPLPREDTDEPLFSNGVMHGAYGTEPACSSIDRPGPVDFAFDPDSAHIPFSASATDQVPFDEEDAPLAFTEFDLEPDTVELSPAALVRTEAEEPGHSDQFEADAPAHIDPPGVSEAQSDSGTAASAEFELSEATPNLDPLLETFDSPTLSNEHSAEVMEVPQATSSEAGLVEEESLQAAPVEASAIEAFDLEPQTSMDEPVVAEASAQDEPSDEATETSPSPIPSQEMEPETALEVQDVEVPYAVDPLFDTGFAGESSLPTVEQMPEVTAPVAELELEEFSEPPVLAAPEIAAEEVPQPDLPVTEVQVLEEENMPAEAPVPQAEAAQSDAERIHQAVERVFDRFKPLLIAAIVREIARSE